MRQQLGSRNFACGIFVDFQKVFDTIDHDILIQKLNHYDIRRVANNCSFFSLLQSRLQYVCINRFNSNFERIHCSVP